MTSDELRDRIENSLAQAGARGKDRAQAIIDGLGLTVETALSLDEIPEHLQDEFIDGAELSAWAEDKPKKARVVGKWEKQ